MPCKSKLKEGDPAPDFELPAHDGSMVRLSDFKGKIVVLYFYPRAMTSGCTREAQRFNELLEEFEKNGAVVLGVSNDPIDKIKRFADKLGLKFKLLSDAENKVIEEYGVLRRRGDKVSANRVTFIISPDGRIVKILKNIRPAEKHADLALEEVKKLRST